MPTRKLYELQSGQIEGDDSMKNLAALREELDHIDNQLTWHKWRNRKRKKQSQSLLTDEINDLVARRRNILININQEVLRDSSNSRPKSS